MPTRLDELQAHASHLLDAFIQLRERYALLEPMLFSEVVTKERGSGKQARGFQVLKHSLVLTCAQDIAKLTMDDDDRAPSLANLIGSLADGKILSELRERFAEWEAPSIEDETDPEIIEALRRLELAEVSERRQQFDRLYCEAMDLWARLLAGGTIKAFRTIRDKVSAHTEVRFVADKYRYEFVDISALGLMWKDFRETIAEMERLVELVGP